MKRSFALYLIEDAIARSIGELLVGSHHITGNGNIVTLAMLGTTGIVNGDTEREKREGFAGKLAMGKGSGESMTKN
ncbi:hypothetical protein GUJ93_ZPchr0004g39846 [Zizania palustris]|uniref:Uncharacterized protein n=1 Tax=Zizania palustris TaxID=103762 RepID=A0A8J5VYY2_ZIZPA|nr:hypothetical protein GUJ93_ZPchr0004g39846 [Zizania palustris]